MSSELLWPEHVHAMVMMDLEVVCTAVKGIDRFIKPERNLVGVEDECL